ncbi:MAG TPA: AAA family ATPase [Verrucomicrobiae bacterium]|nr:AAA family ATPase [Verrucomicrobiae bacterium]
MITKLTLRNFKSIKEETYDFTSLDLFVGWNNSGKSTVLQSLAIWQFCVDEFRRSKRAGKKGIQVILPNFTALPVPVFNLLWHNKTDRKYPENPEKPDKKLQQFITIDIEVTWRANDKEHTFGVALRYHSAQTVYAIPKTDWDNFRKLDQESELPIIAYVPPFSGLEPQEERRDDAPLRKQIGKAQPGSVLRNLLLRVTTADNKNKGASDWQEIVDVVKRWFSVDLLKPQYEDGKDTFITCEYKQKGETYDIIAGGSGFHQTITLLAFLYGYHPTTILLDEPDAHLHVNLQREILDYFKTKSSERGVQFLIATHAEEFIKGVSTEQIVSLLAQKQHRISATPPVLKAMADLSNMEITRLRESPIIVYVEGESDERVLRAWAPKVGAEDWMRQLVFHTMGGGTKVEMKKEADRHFEALHTVLPHVKRVMIFDFDTERTAFHPDPNNAALFEWGRKNIENYLLVPDAWKRAITNDPAFALGEVFAAQALALVDQFFADQNLTLPTGRTWRNIAANVFQVVDGKRILFQGQDSLFSQLHIIEPELYTSREKVAGAMKAEEIHADVLALFAKLKAATV